MKKLEAGDTAPAFALRDQHGETVRLEDFRGRKLLVYFYPEADTPGCTTQSCDVRDHHQELTDLGADVVGISPDGRTSNSRSTGSSRSDSRSLPTPTTVVAEAWGTWGEKKLYGKTYIGITRSSFLIDEEGRVLQAWYRVKANQTVPKAKEALAT